MKKIVLAAIICISVILGGCKEETVVTTKYTIGNLGCNFSPASENMQTLVEYFSSHVAYNKIVTFNNASLAENDHEALNYYNDQIAKLDTAYVCSLLEEHDYFIYGMATLKPDGTYRYIGAIRFEKSGTSDVVQ